MGLLLSWYVTPVMAFLQRVLHFQIFNADVYYVTRIPSQIEPHDVALVAAMALLMTLTATVYPALKAARTEPAEVLRYE